MLKENSPMDKYYSVTLTRSKYHLNKFEFVLLINQVKKEVDTQYKKSRFVSIHLSSSADHGL